MDFDDSSPSRPPGRRQFSLAGLMLTVTAFAVLFAVCRWMGLKPAGSIALALLATLSFVGASLLIDALAGSDSQR